MSVGFFPDYTLENITVIGTSTLHDLQLTSSTIHIGKESGNNTQGNNSVMIGVRAGYTTGSANSIVLNAQDIALDSPTGGVYIAPIRNISGTHTPTYNASSKEIGYIANRYVFALATGTQVPSQTPTYKPVLFDTNEILSNFEHTLGSGVFTGTIVNPAYFYVCYSVEVHANANQARTIGVYVEVDGSPVNGSFRTTTVRQTGDEFSMSNNIVIYLTPGSHGIRLMMATDNTTNGPTLAVSSNITPPTVASGSSANIVITRVA